MKSAKRLGKEIISFSLPGNQIENIFQTLPIFSRFPFRIVQLVWLLLQLWVGQYEFECPFYGILAIGVGGTAASLLEVRGAGQEREGQDNMPRQTTRIRQIAWYRIWLYFYLSLAVDVTCHVGASGSALEDAQVFFYCRWFFPTSC